MCGIAAVFSQKENRHLQKWLWSMVNRAKHRGPDGMGVAVGNMETCLSISETDSEDQIGTFWGLGHTRLSIIDLSESGKQPMVAENGKYWISYNGEVYNYKELRKELSRDGFRFRTGTDTEVVMASYQRWGEMCVQRFIGMFAFVLVDLKQKRVFIARDRFGIKPLYVWSRNGIFAIASETKQFMDLPEFSVKINLQQAADYIVDSLIDHDPTCCFLDNVNPLAPAHILSWHLTKPIDMAKAVCYWNPTRKARNDIGWDEAVSLTKDLFEDSVRLRLRSDVTVGSCLSGGVDSSAIVGIASSHLPHRMNTFSSCFDDRLYDEQPYMDAVLRRWELSGTKIFPTETDLIEDFHDLVYFQDFPIPSTSIYAQYQVLGAARRAGVYVLLDGQGGDEIQYGYRKFSYFF